jgi:hypothetical protein
MNKNRITLFLSGIVLAIFILSGCKQINKQTSNGNQSDSKQKETDTVNINYENDKALIEADIIKPEVKMTINNSFITVEAFEMTDEVKKLYDKTLENLKDTER